MTLQYIELTDLKPASVNVRKHGAKDIADLIPSIEAMGILQPLLVRPNCERFEIVAGQRRYHALKHLAEDNDNIDPVPCLVMEDGDDAAAIEASLAENVARLPMDEIDQYKAFAALIKQGKEVADIASEFGVTERLVTQRLAIANLLSPILTLYRKEEIGAETVRILTMATKKQQKAWLVLWKSEDEHAPEGFRLKNWLFGGAQIPTDNALFDLEAYRGGIVSDLFGENSYFDNPEEFWRLQNAAIAKARQDYLNDGWADVVILEVGEYFPAYEYIDTAKEDGGKVYVKVATDGEVTFYEGQLSRKEVKARDKAKENGETAAPSRPELTKAMQNYLSLHRHAAVQASLLSHQGVALRLAVAQIIAGSELWAVQADPQKASNEDIADSLTRNTGVERMDEERRTVRRLLGLDSNEDETLVYRKDDWGKSHDLHGLFAKLMTLTDDEVTTILTFVTAECLPAGSALVEGLGKQLEVDMSAHWQIDETFFDLMRDKEAINAMVREVAGKEAADGNITATAKVQKKIITDCLNGTRTPKQAGWQPCYMRFPQAAYTKRGGIAAIEQWKAVRKHYR